MVTETEYMRSLMEAAAGKKLLEGSYWSNTGRYEKEANELQQLVPGSGPAETQRGEIMRAATKIYYDFYNNGFGNNWAAPLIFLAANTQMNRSVYEWLAQYAAGNIHGGRGDEQYIERMMDDAIKSALQVPEDKPRKNDMWDTPIPPNEFKLDDEDDEYDEYDYDEDEDY